MQTLNITSNELKKLMREAFIDVLTERKDLIEDAVIEAIEDIALAIAMQEGKTGQFVDSREFIKKLDNKIKNAK